MGHNDHIDLELHDEIEDLVERRPVVSDGRMLMTGRRS
jgi:hypothetical protein